GQERPRHRLRRRPAGRRGQPGLPHGRHQRAAPRIPARPVLARRERRRHPPGAPTRAGRPHLRPGGAWLMAATDAAFRDALSRYASGVVIVTTRDRTGTPHGFTATSFCSVSLDPPLVLVCLARSARCHAAFAQTDAFAVSVL